MLGGLFLALVRPLAVRERQVAVLDHVPNLSLHGDGKQNKKVQYENWPEDGNVHEREECAEESNDSCARDRVPVGKAVRVVVVERGERGERLSLVGVQTIDSLFCSTTDQQQQQQQQTAAVVPISTSAQTYQNLNSGSRRMNGRNSSSLLVGSVGPSSSVGSSFAIAGSI